MPERGQIPSSRAVGQRNAGDDRRRFTCIPLSFVRTMGPGRCYDGTDLPARGAGSWQEDHRRDRRALPIGAGRRWWRWDSRWAPARQL